MSDIFQEVDEEVRRDKALEFWTKHQNTILVVAILIVLATGGWRFWQYRQAQAADAAGAQFQNALKLDVEGKAAEAKTKLADLQRSAPAGYANLTRFVEAGITAKSDSKAGATSYDALADDSALDPLLRDTARLRAALARLSANETDAARSGLEPLAGAGPYRETARLTLASIAIAAKDWKTATRWLEAVVADFEAPQADRRTAQTLLGLVTSQTAK